MRSLDFGDLASWDPEPFREDLAKGGYTLEGVPGIADFGAVVSRVSPETFEQEILCGLFLGDEKVRQKDARKVLPESYESLLSLGLLKGKHGEVKSTLRLRPSPEGYFADDFPSVLGERASGESEEFVMGVAPTTRMLRQLIPAFERKRVLDLCCGGGWLALTEAWRGALVVGSDLSERCLEVARFNARMNCVDSVDWRRGSWFEAVEGEVFDLIVSNPPFVQSPGGKSMALDTPEDVDPVRILLSGMSDYLAEDGVGCLLLNWQYQNEDEWEAFPLACLPDEGLQVILFEVQRHDPKGYARHWIRQEMQHETAEKREAEVKRWVAYLEGRGSAGVSSGFVLMRKCEPGQEWLVLESRELEGFGAATSEEFRTVFENQTWLHNLEAGVSVLDCRFTEVPGVRQENLSVMKKGEWEAESIRLMSPGKVMYDGHVDQALLKIFEGASRGRKIRGCLPEIAKIVGVNSASEIEGGVAGLLAELVGRGLLKPAT